ncbi:MAG: hypothetical protein AAF063_28090 [Cyanobacteria bacterium J06643_5]
MKNKVAAFLAGTVLALTAGVLPSEAVNSSAHSVSNSGTNLEIVNLNNAQGLTSNNTGGKQVKSENGEVLVARRRRRRRARRICSYRWVTRIVRGRRCTRRVRVCRIVRY